MTTVTMNPPGKREGLARRRRRDKDSGRRARLAPGSPTSAVDPCPPGQVGGRYRPLSVGDMEAIYNTSIRILEEIGLGGAPAALSERAVAAGATVDGMGRLCFPRALIEDIIAKACTRFVFHGRESKHDVEVGGDKVYFGTGGAAVQTLDRDSRQYRPSTLVDLFDFARLADELKNIAWFTRCCVATDIPDAFDLDLNTAYALLRGTTKPIGTSFALAEHVQPVVELFDLVLGGTGRFRDRPFCKAHVSPIISPLRFSEDAVEVAIACVRHGVVINNVVAAQCGATAPATLAGALATSLAETLAGLTMVNLFAPGYPVVFSNWPLVTDLRSGNFTSGGGEIALLNAASAQISNWLGLPSGVAAGMADAKAVDAQMGMEKAITSLAAGLSGANLVYESSGMMASLLGASFDAFVIDDEMLSHVYRMLRGVEVNEETLGFAAVREAVDGEGHFLGGAHTFNAMRRDHYFPRLADRDRPREREGQDATAIWDRAARRAGEILDTHTPEYLPPGIDRRIRDRFNILLTAQAPKRTT